MLPCHSCYIYGTWRSKEVGLQNLKEGPTKSKGGIFMWELPHQLFYQNYPFQPL